MKVLKYTEKIQKAVNSKIKAEAWLHLIAYEYDSKFYYVICVWDTREIVDFSEISRKTFDLLEDRNANDNHKPLKGKGAEKINEAIRQTQNHNSSNRQTHNRNSSNRPPQNSNSSKVSQSAYIPNVQSKQNPSEPASYIRTRIKIERLEKT